MKTLYTLVVAFVVVVLGYLLITTYLRNDAQGSGQVPDTTITADFVSDSGGSIHVVFDTTADSALLTGAGFDRVTLLRAISGSGARYENTDLGLVLWNKGNDVTLTDDDTVVFSGTIKGSGDAMQGAGVDTTDPESGATFRYPETLGTLYINTVDWPPSVRVESEPFSCTNIGIENVPTGKTEHRTINGRDYCVTTEGEGAAGSVYTQYAYAAPINDMVVYLTFSTRAVQCLNYDEPQQSECAAERAAFDVDSIADGIFTTITLP